MAIMETEVSKSHARYVRQWERCLRNSTSKWVQHPSRQWASFSFRIVSLDKEDAPVSEFKYYCPLPGVNEPEMPTTLSAGEVTSPRCRWGMDR